MDCHTHSRVPHQISESKKARAAAAAVCRTNMIFIFRPYQRGHEADGDGDADAHAESVHPSTAAGCLIDFMTKVCVRARANVKPRTATTTTTHTPAHMPHVLAASRNIGGTAQQRPICDRYVVEQICRRDACASSMQIGFVFFVFLCVVGFKHTARRSGLPRPRRFYLNNSTHGC